MGRGARARRRGVGAAMEVPFGIRDGEFVDVYQVPRGKACGCVCPECGKGLVAKQGEIVAHHFAHEADANCQYAAESFLHAAAKSVLHRTKALSIPQVYCSVGNYSWLHKKSEVVLFDDVELEKAVLDFIPDAIGHVQGRSICIEFTVTHAVDSFKRRKIVNAGMDAVEVDLRSLMDTDSLAEIEEFLTRDCRRWWLHNTEIAVAESLVLRGAQRSRILYSIARGWPEVRCVDGSLVGLRENCYHCKRFLSDIGAEESAYPRPRFSPVAILCNGAPGNADKGGVRTPEEWRRPRPNVISVSKTALQQAEEAFGGDGRYPRYVSRDFY